MPGHEHVDTVLLEELRVSLLDSGFGLFPLGGQAPGSVADCDDPRAAFPVLVGLREICLQPPQVLALGREVARGHAEDRAGVAVVELWSMREVGLGVNHHEVNGAVVEGIPHVHHTTRLRRRHGEACVVRCEVSESGPLGVPGNARWGVTFGLVVAYSDHEGFCIRVVLDPLHVCIVNRLVAKLEHALARVVEGVVGVADVASNEHEVGGALQRLYALSAGNGVTLFSVAPIADDEHTGLHLVRVCHLEMSRGRLDAVRLDVVVVALSLAEALESRSVVVATILDVVDRTIEAELHCVRGPDFGHNHCAFVGLQPSLEGNSHPSGARKCEVDLLRPPAVVHGAAAERNAGLPTTAQAGLADAPGGLSRGVAGTLQAAHGVTLSVHLAPLAGVPPERGRVHARTTVRVAAAGGGSQEREGDELQGAESMVELEGVGVPPSRHDPLDCAVTRQHARRHTRQRGEGAVAPGEQGGCGGERGCVQKTKPP
mmetsp:Transcript_41610/g.89326  ORF Transcript_41610/g.89326 Transcript_41610/m.89326 type:complete len:486 (+) Transcript_41610:323-1780(+)